MIHESTLKSCKLVCIVMLLHSWAFDHPHYKIVDHFEVRHFIQLLLKKITSSTTNWTKNKCNHLIDQWRYGFSISPPSWTIVNVCRLQTCHFVNLLHFHLQFFELEKMPFHFWVETKLKEIVWFPYLIWTVGC